MKSLLLIFVVALTASVFCYAQENKYSFSERYQLGSSAKVKLSCSDGNIDVVTSDGGTTEVFYIVKKNNKVLDISRVELEKELTLEVVQAGNSLSIMVKHKTDWSLLSWKDHMEVSFRLQVPKETACNLRTSDGNINMKGLSGDQSGNTSDGNIAVSDIKGSVFASTSDGNINVKKVVGAVEVKTSDGNIEMQEIKGDTKAGTSDGNIALSKISGNIFVKTSDGDIKFTDLSGSFTASTSDGNVSGSILKLTRELTVKTSDGNIIVTIPDNLGLDLDVKAESLDVPLSNFSGHSDENTIRGKSNGGGVAVNLSTSGMVRLVYK